MSTYKTISCVDSGFSDTPFEIRNCTYDIDGYEFAGWNTKPDGTGQAFYPNTSAVFQDNVMLYAQWKLLYKNIQLVYVGDIQVKSNIASDFSEGNGLRTPSFFRMSSSTNFDILLKITIGADAASTLAKQVLLRMSTIDQTHKMCLCIGNSKLVFEETGAVGTCEYNAGVPYYVKIVKNGTQLQVYRSTDNSSFQLDLDTSTSYSAAAEYLVFGQSYSYEVQHSTKVTTTEYVAKDIYEYKDIWHTSNSCAYADKNGRTYSYATKLKHSTNDHSKSTSCGYWARQQVVAGTKLEPVTTTRTVTTVTSCKTAGFIGTIDFNESFLTMNGAKYKLKA